MNVIKEIVVNTLLQMKNNLSLALVFLNEIVRHKDYVKSVKKRMMMEQNESNC